MKLREAERTIGLVAPSGHLYPGKEKRVEIFKQYMHSLGLRVVSSPNFYKVDEYTVAAGNPEERASDLNAFFQDDAIDIIWALRGGYAAIEVLDKLDYDMIAKHPKPFIGKSNIDIISLALHKKSGLIAFHGPDPCIGDPKTPEMDNNYTKKSFQDRFMEASKIIEPEYENSWKTIRSGTMRGKLLGCNNDSILQLLGTDYLPDFQDSILFLETFNESVAGVYKTFALLEHHGILGKLSGMVIGHNAGWHGERFDKQYSVEDIAEERTRKYGFPMIQMEEFGHYQSHAFLPIGAEIMVDSIKEKIHIISE